MVAIETQNLNIPALKVTDSLDIALNLMDDFKVSYLPLVNDGIFSGYISQDSILNNFGDSDLLSGLEPEFATLCILEYAHYFDAITLLSSNDKDLIAIVDTERNYKGLTTAADLLKSISKTLTMDSLGAIIILSIHPSNYSLAEISRLVESNDTKILGLHIESDIHPDNKLLVTIKLNSDDSSKVVATLERFNYSIIGSFGQEIQEDISKDRFDNLMKYLQI